MTTSTFMRLRARRKSAGVAIVTAIFLLIVVAGLAVAVVSLSSSQQTASAQDVQAQRAYHAAKAGIEWAVYTGMTTRDPPTPAASLNCTAQQNQVTSTVGLNNGTFPGGFTVTVIVSCDADVGGIAQGARTIQPRTMSPSPPPPATSRSTTLVRIRRRDRIMSSASCARSYKAAMMWKCMCFVVEVEYNQVYSA
ncbi:hypothetical protein [Duganella sp. P38]|uniref:hypothetical protein n=1 Tax=Duganella sp. P38 TaxID=3423949 RepID=UPI003D797AD7